MVPISAAFELTKAKLHLQNAILYAMCAQSNAKAIKGGFFRFMGTIDCHNDGGIVTVTLNNPAKLN
ncbi:MAG: hypothetical protein AAFY83_04215, partial [Pseudomonadota bacterium]